MKRFLLVVCAAAALCAICCAQVPGYNPPSTPKYARAELFAGYSYGYTDLFNSGNRANLNGWNGSLALNVANWLGFVFDASGFYGTSRIPVAVPAPFPTCPTFCPGTSGTFNVNTRLYNYLFGAQIPYRKSQTWTPFAEVLFGHSGIRGTVPGIAEASGGLGLIGGIGVDRNDALGTGKCGAIDGRQPDPAATDHRDRGTRLDFGGVEYRTPPGHHAASDQCGAVERDIGIDLHH